MTSSQPTWASAVIRQPIRRPRTLSRRAMLLSGAAAAIGLPMAAAGPARANSTARQSADASQPGGPTQLTLAAPTGPHPLGTTTLYLVDPSRPDPWVPAIPYRALVIQLWYPAAAVAGYPRVPWMTPITAHVYEQMNGLPDLLMPVTYGHLAAPVRRRDGGWPVVLFSPGTGNNRAEATALVQYLASHGYIVACIDHIHDADVVELPDGSVATSAIPPFTDDNEIQQTTKLVESRFADALFILDQLEALNRGANPDHAHRPVPQGLHGALDLNRVGMFGHSDGGSTTAHALHVSRRIRAGVNLDGTLWTPEAQAGSDHALLLFGRQDLDSFEAQTWATLRTNQRGPHLQLNLTGSTHATFSDFPVLLPQVASLIGLSPAQVIEAEGSIDGERAISIQRAYVNAFFDTYLRDSRDHGRHHRSRSTLLSGPSAHYPEVVFA